MTCHDCGEQLDTVPAGQPSPQCRGARPSALPMAQTLETLADAMAQTTKHPTTTRRDNPITARIAEIHITPEGARARIEWSRPAGSKGSRDALELAYGCLRSWRRFVRAQKL